MAEPYSYLKQYYEAFDQFKIVSKTDPKGYITYANLNFAKISGYYREELLGKKHNIVRHPDMDKKVFENMWKTILSGHVWRGEVKNKRKDGSAYWTKSDIIPIFKDDIIVEFVSIREDITEKKLMELKLKKDSIFKKELFEALPNVSMLIHQEKGLVMCNNQFFKEFNVSSSEEFNKNYSCVCELFIEKKGYLKKSTKEKHWTEIYFEDPENNNRAIIKNKEGKEQVFFVSINSFKDKNLFLVSFVNISFLDSDDNCIVFDNPGEKIGEVLQFINKLFDNGLDPEKAKEIKYIEKVLLDR